MKYSIDYFRSLIALCMLTLLAACGGSGGGEETPEDTPDDTPVEGPSIVEPLVTSITYNDSEVIISWAHALETSDDPVDISYTFYYATEQIENDVNSEGEAEEEDLTLADLQDRFNGLSGAISVEAVSPFTIPNTVNDTSYYFVITATTDADGTSNPSNELRATPRDYSTANVYQINDTGYLECGDYAFFVDVGLINRTFEEGVDIRNSGQHDNHINCLAGDVDDDGDTLPEATTQDAFFGRDFLASTGALTKTGAGVAGFDFTKLDSNGSVLAASAESWSCVADNHTGLIWEIKTTEEGLHNAVDRYSWYSTDSLSNGGNDGFSQANTFDANQQNDTCFGYDEADSTSYCNTQAFVQRVNSAGLCGANDWRMPTREELVGIIEYLTANNNDQADPIQNPSVDTDYFPNAQVTQVTGVLEEVRYFSGSPSAANPESVWGVYFGAGGAPLLLKGQLNPVRLVRTGP